VLHLAATEQDRDLDLVVVLKKLAGLGHLRFNVVVASLGADADLLQLLLADLAGLIALLRLLKAQLAVVKDLTDRGAFVGGHLDQVKSGFPGLLQGLRRGHQAQLFPVSADEADGADADLFIHAWAAIRRRLAVEMSNRAAPLKGWQG